jgi:uncharacterized protein (DUF433 family)
MSDKKRTLSEEEIDEIVTAQADDDSAWEKPVKVKRSRVSVLTFDEEQLARLPITADPEMLSGAPVFRGTRVVVASLLDNLAAGLTLDEFLDNFPTVRREQAVQVLEFYKEALARLSRAAGKSFLPSKRVKLKTRGRGNARTL